MDECLAYSLQVFIVSSGIWSYAYELLIRYQTKGTPSYPSFIMVNFDLKSKRKSKNYLHKYADCIKQELDLYIKKGDQNFPINNKPYLIFKDKCIFNIGLTDIN